MTKVQVDYWNLVESKRHNEATESLSASQLEETKRSNIARESETYRHDVATEKEANRHNVKTESLTASEIAESIRHNKVSEETERYKAKETARHNLAQESLSATDIQEKMRHNLATEGIESSKVAETQRHNIKSETVSQQDADTRSFSANAEAIYKSAKSTAEFANAMAKAGLKTLDKIYIIEELLLNPNISKASKQELMKLEAKFQKEVANAEENARKALGLTKKSKTANSDKSGITSKNPYPEGSAAYNLWQKQHHK